MMAVKLHAIHGNYSREKKLKSLVEDAHGESNNSGNIQAKSTRIHPGDYRVHCAGTRLGR
jgi:hypothetical protein